MTPEVNLNHVQRDVGLLAPTVVNDGVVQRGPASVTLRPSSRLTRASSEPHNDVQFVAPCTARDQLRAHEVAKRGLVLLIGPVLLIVIVATPIILIAAICIRLETRGSPFFIQQRLGKNGKCFRTVKLRGIFIDARSRFADYCDYSKHCNLEFCFHYESDPWVTRAVKFIRRTSIDGLSNLWNVVLGDMSLVGPRHEIREVLALYGSYRLAYLSVKPGVTCLSSCTGRDRLTKRETIEVDPDYIRKRSFGLDLRILWRPFRGVILRRDVIRETDEDAGAPPRLTVACEY